MATTDNALRRGFGASVSSLSAGVTTYLFAFVGSKFSKTWNGTSFPTLFFALFKYSPIFLPFLIFFPIVDRHLFSECLFDSACRRSRGGGVDNLTPRIAANPNPMGDRSHASRSAKSEADTCASFPIFLAFYLPFPGGAISSPCSVICMGRRDGGCHCCRMQRQIPTRLQLRVSRTRPYMHARRGADGPPALTTFSCICSSLPIALVTWAEMQRIMHASNPYMRSGSGRWELWAATRVRVRVRLEYGPYRGMTDSASGRVAAVSRLGEHHLIFELCASKPRCLLRLRLATRASA